MIAKSHEVYSVHDRMRQRQLDVAQLSERSGVEYRVVEAICEQRYTPSPEQRDRVSEVLGLRRDQLRWGHVALVDQLIHAPD